MNTVFVHSSLAADPDLCDLVDRFIQEMPDRINALESQARSRDWQQLSRTAHQLKGAAGSYGFAALTPMPPGWKAPQGTAARSKRSSCRWRNCWISAAACAAAPPAEVGNGSML